MGYDSMFDLGVYDFAVFKERGESAPLSEQFSGVVDTLRVFSEDAQFALDEGGDSTGWAKWDSLEEDMQEFSRRYPALLFIVTVCGQEGGDYWQLFARDGRYVTVPGWIEYGKPDLDEFEPKPLQTETMAIK